MKFDRKVIFNAFYKNRFLILSGLVLVFGTYFGTSMLEHLPNKTCENFFIFVSKSTESFSSAFLNKFCFPFITLLFIFLAGFSAVGKITALITLFINGAFFGLENGIKYMFLSTDYIFDALISYFTATVFFGFLLIIMSENSVFFSNRIFAQLKSSTYEISHYNAKNQAVKFITFTAIIAVFSAFSAYITPILRGFL